MEVVEGCINVPPVESCEFAILVGWYDLLVERLVMWMLQGDVLEAFELCHWTITNDLNIIVRLGVLYKSRTEST